MRVTALAIVALCLLPAWPAGAQDHRFLDDLRPGGDRRKPSTSSDYFSDALREREPLLRERDMLEPQPRREREPVESPYRLAPEIGPLDRHGRSRR